MGSKNVIFDNFPLTRFKIWQQIRNPREILRRNVCTTFYFAMPRNPKISPKTVKNKLKMTKIGPKYRFFPMKFVLACPAQQKRNVNFKRDQNHELWCIRRPNSSATLLPVRAGMACRLCKLYDFSTVEVIFFSFFKSQSDSRWNIYANRYIFLNFFWRTVI